MTQLSLVAKTVHERRFRTTKTTVWKVSRHKARSFLFALVFGLVLALLPIDAFKDRVTYLQWAVNSWDILTRFWSRGVVTTLANEPLWFLLNAVLGVFFSAEVVVRLLIAIPASVVAYVMLREGRAENTWLVVFFLLSPWVIEKHVLHLRQAVAIAVFLVAWYSQNRWRWFGLLVTPFIHSSFTFVVGLVILDYWIRRARISPTISVMAYIHIAIAMGLSMQYLASLLGARQALVGYFSMGDVSGMGFIFWSAILGLYILEGKGFATRHGLALSAIILFLVLYFFTNRNARIFQNLYVLVLLAGLELSGWRRLVFVAAMGFYVITSWILSALKPGFGFLALPG